MLLTKPSSKFGESHYYECVKDKYGSYGWKSCAENKDNYDAWRFLVCTISAEVTTDDYFGYAIDRQSAKTIADFNLLPDGIKEDLLNRLALTGN